MAKDKPGRMTTTMYYLDGRCVDKKEIPKNAKFIKKEKVMEERKTKSGIVWGILYMNEFWYETEK